MDTVTPDMGADTVTSAAEKIGAILEPDGDPNQQELTPDEAHEEQTAAEESEPEEAQEGDTEGELEANAEAQEDEPHTWTLEELADAMDTTPEKVGELIKLRAKVRGEESEVTLAEALNGYQRESDYTRQTMELGEKRKAFEAEQEKAKSEIESALSQANAIIQANESGLLTEFNSVNWEELRELDPAEYAAKRQEYAERYQSIQAQKQQLWENTQKIQAEQTEKFREQAREWLKLEGDKLVQKIPEWNDAVKAQQGVNSIRDYLASEGYTSDELKATFPDGLRFGAVDHRQLLIARKAMLYDQLQRAKPEVEKKVASKPKFVKPGARKTKAEQQTEAHRQRMARLKKSGRVEDAAGLIGELLDL